MNTKTPETDNEFPQLFDAGNEYRLVDFARRLERERDNAREHFQAAMSEVARLERNEAREGILRNGRFVTVTSEQFDALIGQRDRLAEALTMYLLPYSNYELERLASCQTGRGEISPKAATREIKARAALATVTRP